MTLKKFMDKMKDVVYELKKQGVNINQIARDINSYLGFATEEAFRDMKNLIKMWKTEYWNYWRRWRNGRSIWKCECKYNPCKSIAQLKSAADYILGKRKDK